MTRFARLAWGAALLTLMPAVADAQLTQLAFPSRTSLTLISTSSADFSDAKATITAITQVATGVAGGRGLNLVASINIVTLGTKSTSDIGVNAAITKQFPQYGVSQIDGSVAATGPGGGSFSLVESYGHDTDPYGFGPLYRYADRSFYQDRQDYGFLPPFTQTGLPSLEFFFRSPAAVSSTKAERSLPSCSSPATIRQPPGSTLAPASNSSRTSNRPGRSPATSSMIRPAT